jgi:hypothetical protein
MKKNEGQEGKINIFQGVVASGRRVGTRKERLRVYIVCVVSIHT